MQCYSIFSTFAIFATSVSQCFAKFRKMCFASFANTSFARFRKYFFSQFYACFARFARFGKYEFRKVTQFSVSQEFANRFFVSQVSQGFCNGHFADDPQCFKFRVTARLQVQVQPKAAGIRLAVTNLRVSCRHRQAQGLAVSEPESISNIWLSTSSKLSSIHLESCFFDKPCGVYT